MEEKTPLEGKENPFASLPKINQGKLSSLIEQLRKENIPEPRNRDITRILRVSAAQATLYLKEYRKQKAEGRI